MGGLVLRTRADSDELKQSAIGIENAAWGPLGYLNYTRAHREYYDEILEAFPDYQLCLIDEETERPVALANTVPARWDGETRGLPSEGWDWLVESGAKGSAGEANVLGALAISVPNEERGRGYATRMIREMRQLAERRGLDAVLAPVRPTSKCDYPFVPMADYIGWRDAEGRHFDPWLRSHLAQGGRLVGPCERSMVVEQHIAFWETWAGRHFDRSGDYVLNGALAPVSIDLERQRGIYEEPNVWVTYSS